MVESFAAGATAATETCKRIGITIAALALLFIGVSCAGGRPKLLTVLVQAEATSRDTWAHVCEETSRLDTGVRALT